MHERIWTIEGNNEERIIAEVLEEECVVGLREKPWESEKDLISKLAKEH